MHVRPKTRRRNRKKFAQGKKAFAICDRTGFKHRMRDMVVEPGTGILVYKRWSDGEWNRVDHAQNFPADTREAIGLKNPRTDTYNPEMPYLIDLDNGEDLLILAEDGMPIYVD